MVDWMDQGMPVDDSELDALAEAGTALAAELLPGEDFSDWPYPPIQGDESE